MSELGREPSGDVPSDVHWSQRVPWQIWIAVALLSIEGIGNLLSIPRVPMAAVWLAAKMLIIAGLLRAWRWMYVVFLAIAAYHVFYFVAAGPYVYVAFLNLVLVLLVATSYRYFFPVRGPSE